MSKRNTASIKTNQTWRVLETLIRSYSVSYYSKVKRTVCVLSIGCPLRVAGRNFHLRAASSQDDRSSTGPSIAFADTTLPLVSIAMEMFTDPTMCELRANV